MNGWYFDKRFPESKDYPIWVLGLTPESDVIIFVFEYDDKGFIPESATLGMVLKEQVYKLEKLDKTNLH